MEKVFWKGFRGISVDYDTLTFSLSINVLFEFLSTKLSLPDSRLIRMASVATHARTYKKNFSLLFLKENVFS